MIVMKADHITKTYGEGDVKVKALDDVSLTVEKGELTAILGPSGTGKSTLLHMIGGVDMPTSGDITISDTVINKLKDKELTLFRRRKIGFVYQFFNLIPVLNVEENILLPKLLDKKNDSDSRLDELLEILELKERRLHFPSQLSGGQQQRAAIGRALITNPELILADEPTGNLDSRSGEIVIHLLERIHEEMGATILIVTHDLWLASHCRRLIFLKDGKIVEDLRREEGQKEFYQKIISREERA